MATFEQQVCLRYGIYKHAQWPSSLTFDFQDLISLSFQLKVWAIFEGISLKK